jgi:hypothetical protein
MPTRLLPETILHNTIAAVPPAGASVVALEDQGWLCHVELRQKPPILWTDGYEVQQVPLTFLFKSTGINTF